MQESIDYTYDLANRLWSKGTTAYTNSNIGERLTKADGSVTWTYQYDGESRLVKALNNGTTVSENIYDGSGMRIKKVESGKTVYFVYNGNDPIVEYSATEGIYSYYIYAGKQTIAEESNGVIKFYHKDHLGSTRVVTDIVGVKVIDYNYEPFGKIINGSNGGHQFTGKEQDKTELYYFGARYYDQDTGRFVTIDPAKDGVNWYEYCRNNPLNVIDPSGLLSVIIYYNNLSSDRDQSFKRAADTDAKMRPDSVLEIGVTTESDFDNAWSQAVEASKNDSVSEISIYCHGDSSNLYFMPNKSDDGILTGNDIGSLGQISFSNGGIISIYACHSGEGANSPAQSFADSQGVTTFGQLGYAYFSESLFTYQAINGDSKDVYLGAYNRGQNNFFGNGDAIPSAEHKPN
jgi:RHS repeat-associated protein